MDDSKFRFIHEMTHSHRRLHRCHAYPFNDGDGLIKAVNKLQPKKVLELGTALGYTACCFASASDCHVDTVEGDATHVELARENIAKSGFADKVTVHHGDFLAVIKNLPNDYDIVFFDGLAPSVSMLKTIHAKLREGGTLICANLGFAEAGAEEFLNDKKYFIPKGELEGGGTKLVEKA